MLKDSSLFLWRFRSERGNQTLSVHVVHSDTEPMDIDLDLGAPRRCSRSPCAPTTQPAGAQWSPPDNAPVTHNMEPYGTFENMKVMRRLATSFHPRPHGPRSPRLFESTKHCLDSFYVGRPGHQMRNRVNTMWTRFQLKLSKRCIRFIWPSKATLSTESVLCGIIWVFSYIIYKYVYIQYIMC